jgi:hypothetical protein
MRLSLEQLKDLDRLRDLAKELGKTKIPKLTEGELLSKLLDLNVVVLRLVNSFRSRSPSIRQGKITYRQEWIRCSSQCKCNQGKGHGPYFYAYWRDQGKLKSKYIGKTLKLD